MNTNAKQIEDMAGKASKVKASVAAAGVNMVALMPALEANREFITQEVFDTVSVFYARKAWVGLGYKTVALWVAAYKGLDETAATKPKRTLSPQHKRGQYHKVVRGVLNHHRYIVKGSIFAADPKGKGKGKVTADSVLKYLFGTDGASGAWRALSNVDRATVYDAVHTAYEATVAQSA